ncbi:MAG: hypothetical protein FWD30_03245 [Dehalococcoidia bacterium]|nr:hypothetical protein [Dehalococcoidia bacterium]
MGMLMFIFSIVFIILALIMFVLRWANLTKKKHSFTGKAVRIALYFSAVLFITAVMSFHFLPAVGYLYLILGFSIAVFGILQAKLSKKENETEKMKKDKNANRDDGR